MNAWCRRALGWRLEPPSGLRDEIGALTTLIPGELSGSAHEYDTLGDRLVSLRQGVLRCIRDQDNNQQVGEPMAEDCLCRRKRRMRNSEIYMKVPRVMISARECVGMKNSAQSTAKSLSIGKPQPEFSANAESNSERVPVPPPGSATARASHAQDQPQWDISSSKCDLSAHLPRQRTAAQ
jgi:hypothetical protein